MKKRKHKPKLSTKPSKVEPSPEGAMRCALVRQAIEIAGREWEETSRELQFSGRFQILADRSATEHERDFYAAISEICKSYEEEQPCPVSDVTDVTPPESKAVDGCLEKIQPTPESLS